MNSLALLLSVYLLQFSPFEGIIRHSTDAEDSGVEQLLIRADGMSANSAEKRELLLQAWQRAQKRSSSNDRLLTAWHLSRHYQDSAPDSMVYYLRLASGHMDALGHAPMAGTVAVDLGRYYNSLEYYDVAARYYRTAQQIYTALNDTVNIWWALYLQALNLQRAQDHQRAIDKYRESMRWVERPADLPRMVATNVNIALNHYRLSQYDSAVVHYRRALPHVFTPPMTRYLTATAYTLGRSLIELGEYAEGDRWLETAYNSTEASIVPHGVKSGSRVFQAKLERLRGNYPLAERRLAQSDSVLEAYGIDDANIRAQWLKEHVLLNEATGRYREALAYQDRLLEFRDSLTQAALAHSLDRQRREHEMVSQERAAAQLQSESERRRRMLLLVGFAGATGLLVIGFLMLNLRSKQRHNAALIGKQREIESVNREMVATIQALNEARAKADVATSEKLNFLSILSHEIRTPLNALIGATNFMSDDDPPERFRDLIGVLKISSNNLLHLINNILDLGRLESGNVQPEHIPFNIRLLVTDLHSVAQVSAREKALPVALTIDPVIPDMLVGDPYLLGQVLQNLMANAVKFTTEGSVRVTVDCLQLERRHCTLAFTVKDTGIGIPSHFHRSIFNDYTQATADTHRRYGGSGLGLSICQKILQLLGSELNLESDKGKGAEFSFLLPFEVASSTSYAPIAPTEMERSLNKICILLVEDNVFNVEVMKRLLELWLFSDIDIAENGKQAVEMAGSKNYDLILTDLHMPVMDGFESTRLIRALRGLHDSTPIIAVTADTQPETREKALASGVDELITKPFHPDYLRKRILSWVQERAS